MATVLKDEPLILCKVKGPLKVWKGPLHSDKFLREGLKLLKDGAKWGDLEVYSIQENIDILANPKVKIVPEIDIDFGDF